MNDPGNIFDKNKPAHVEHPVNNPVNVPALKTHFTLFFGRFSIAKVINNKFIPTRLEIAISNIAFNGNNIIPKCSVMYNAALGY